jgi:ADP-dependent NAD(P)H-hydrate dehydratase
MLQSPHVDRVLDAELLRRDPLPDHSTADKLARGTVLVLGGSDRTPGAAMLAGIAALRMGAGRLQIATARAVAPTVAVATPEALVVPIDDMPLLGELVERADAVVVGPGLPEPRHAEELLDLVLERATSGSVVVVDALAIQALKSSAGGIPRCADKNVIITPNREELEQLGVDTERDDLEAAVAGGHRVTVISFGCVATPDGGTWRDPTPVRGLGTSGAGDVLAGAAGGAAARSQDPTCAACWAALTHRVAATRLATRIAPIGYLARELADELPHALAELSG